MLFRSFIWLAYTYAAVRSKHTLKSGLYWLVCTLLFTLGLSVSKMLQIGSVFSVFLMLQALKTPKIKPLGRGVFYALVLVWAFAQFNGLQYNVNSLIGVSTLLSNAETIRILAVWVLGLEILEMAYHKIKIVTRCIKSNYLKALCFGIFFSLLNLYLNLEWHLFMVMESWVLFRAIGFFMTSFRLRSRLNWITKCVFIAGLSLYFFNHIENTSNLFIKQAARNWQVKQNANTDSLDRKSTRLNSSHIPLSRMPSSA